jgi:hypothetical protein
VTARGEADGTYVDAVVTTPLFTLIAPKLRVVGHANRVKIQVLARVKQVPAEGSHSWTLSATPSEAGGLGAPSASTPLAIPGRT